MAPEQFNAEKLDRRADIYAMGVVLWEIATRQRMWKGTPDAQVMFRVVNGDIPAPSSVTAEIDPALDAIIVKALAPRREDRYATCLELQADLDKIAVTSRRIDAREIGQTLQKMFAHRRAERRAVIESQLKRLDEVDSSEFTAAPLPTLTISSRTGRSAGGRHSTATGSSPSRSGASVSSSSSMSGGELSELDSHSGVLRSVPPRRENTRKAAIGGAIAVVVAAALIVGLTRRTSPPAPPVESRTDPIPQVTPASTPAAAPPSPRAVRITLRAKPADARLFLDDRPLPGNPIEQAVPFDATTLHALRVEAKDYVTKRVDLTFDREFDVTIALDRAEAPGFGAARKKSPATPSVPATPATSVPPTAAPAPPPTQAADAGAPKKGRALDPNIPWE